MHFFFFFYTLLRKWCITLVSPFTINILPNQLRGTVVAFLGLSVLCTNITHLPYGMVMVCDVILLSCNNMFFLAENGLFLGHLMKVRHNLCLDQLIMDFSNVVDDGMKNLLKNILCFDHHQRYNMQKICDVIRNIRGMLTSPMSDLM